MAILNAGEKSSLQSEITNLLGRFQKMAAIADRLSSARQTNITNNFYIQIGEIQRRYIKVKESIESLIEISDQTTIEKNIR